MLYLIRILFLAIIIIITVANINSVLHSNTQSLKINGHDNTFLL